MEEVDVQRLPRRELLQLCADNNIRTAGVKQDDLVRLLQKKLHRPATDPSRVTTKTSSNLPISSPRGKDKSAEKTPPTPGSTIQRRSLRSLVLVDDPSMQASPKASPRKNQQVSPTPSVLPRKTIATTPSTPTGQRSNLLHKNVTALTAIGKLQAQERARPGKQNDGRGRGTTTAATAPGPGKQASDAASVRSRSTSAPKKSIRSTSMEPVKRPGERVKRSEASRFKAQSNPKLNAAYLEAAAKKSPASATSKAGSRYGSELGSHDYDNVSEIATDVGHQEDSDDARSVTSVASEPASRFTPQIRTSEASKLGRGVSHGAHERNCSYDESCPAPKGKHADGDNLFSQEDDTAFSFVGDADELEINSFLNANIDPPEDITTADDSPETSCQDKIIVVHEENHVREHEAAGHAPSFVEDIRESEPVEERPGAEETNSPIEVSHLDESSTTLKETEDTMRSKGISLSEAEEGLKSNLIDDEESPKAAITSNAQHEPSPTRQDSNALSANDLPQESFIASTAMSVQSILHTQQDSIALSTNDLPQESAIASSAKSVHSILDTAPVPHPNMERSQITPMSVDSTPTLDELETSGEQEPVTKTLRSPCDELQQEFEIKLRRDYNKDGNKSNVLEDRSVKVPLLQQGREAESTLLARRSFPSSILLWCSQLFSAIFGTRNQRC